VSESDIGNLKVGNPAVFTVEAFPERPFTGSVMQVRQAPQSVQNVITYDVVVSVSNPQLLLKPGMTAAVRIVTAERADVVRVPDQALRYRPGGLAAATGDVPTAPAPHAPPPNPQQRTGTVWMLRSGKPVRVPITVGLDDDTYTEVLAGALQAGDPIIVGESTGAAGGGTSAPRMPRL
jgi:HlyD family secretion protein